MTIARRSIRTSCGDVSWLEAGAGWPVVLLHAFPLVADMWRPQLERVPPDCRFIAPELAPAPGEASRDPTVDDYARGVGALLDSLAIDTAVIGGLSMGGYVTFALHRQMPARFSGMILADTRSQPDTPETRAGRARMRTLAARGGAAAVADEMLPKLLSPATLERDAPLVAAVRRVIESNTPEAIDAALAAMAARPDSTPDLARISCATLVVAGAEDTVTPVAEAEALQRAIDRSTLVVLPGAAHLSNLERPDAFSRALGNFLIAHL